MDFLDLTQLGKVLDELDSAPTPLESGWGELSNILDEIKNDQTVKNKVKIILQWIHDNPTHSFPKKVKGWHNAIRSQFCPVYGVPEDAITAETVVEHMIHLKILDVQEYERKVLHKPVLTNRVRINLKRCREETSDSELERKRSKTTDDLFY